MFTSANAAPSPWIGITVVFDTNDPGERARQLGTGVTLGGDVVKHGHHRVALFASGSYARQLSFDVPGYHAGSIGLGYRFW